MEGNPLCCPNYRAQVTKALPKLEVLDGVSECVYNYVCVCAWGGGGGGGGGFLSLIGSIWFV